MPGGVKLPQGSYSTKPSLAEDKIIKGKVEFVRFNRMGQLTEEYFHTTQELQPMRQTILFWPLGFNTCQWFDYSGCWPQWTSNHSLAFIQLFPVQHLLRLKSRSMSNPPVTSSSAYWWWNRFRIVRTILLQNLNEKLFLSILLLRYTPFRKPVWEGHWNCSRHNQTTCPGKSTATEQSISSLIGSNEAITNWDGGWNLESPSV